MFHIEVGKNGREARTHWNACDLPIILVAKGELVVTGAQLKDIIEKIWFYGKVIEGGMWTSGVGSHNLDGFVNWYVGRSS